MTQNDRDLLKQEAQLTITQGGIMTLAPETILQLIADYDDLLNENHDLIEDLARAETDATNLQDALELGEEEAA